MSILLFYMPQCLARVWNAAQGARCDKDAVGAHEFCKQHRVKYSGAKKQNCGGCTALLKEGVFSISAGGAVKGHPHGRVRGEGSYAKFYHESAWEHFGRVDTAIPANFETAVAEAAVGPAVGNGSGVLGAAAAVATEAKVAKVAEAKVAAVEVVVADYAAQVADLSVKELKKTITDAGLSHQDCFEKPMLRVRAVEALERLAEAKVLAAAREANAPSEALTEEERARRAADPDWEAKEGGVSEVKVDAEKAEAAAEALAAAEKAEAVAAALAAEEDKAEGDLKGMAAMEAEWAAQDAREMAERAAAEAEGRGATTPVGGEEVKGGEGGEGGAKGKRTKGAATDKARSGKKESKSTGRKKVGEEGPAKQRYEQGDGNKNKHDDNLYQNGEFGAKKFIKP